MVPTRRSVKISSRYNEAGSTFSSGGWSGRVAICLACRRRLRIGKDALPAVGALPGVRIIAARGGAEIPVLLRLRRRGLLDIDRLRRRIVVGRCGSVVIRRRIVEQ